MVRHSASTSTEGGVLSHKQAPTVSINGDRTRSLQEPVTGSSRSNPSYSNQNFGDGYAIPEGGYGAVRQSVIDMVMTNSQAFWPADFNPPTGPNYAGLLIRLAWHCNGSYRVSDGRGGCDGGAIRFPPESQWPDNESLNMVRTHTLRVMNVSFSFHFSILFVSDDNNNNITLSLLFYFYTQLLCIQYAITTTIQTGIGTIETCQGEARRKVELG